MKELIEGGLSYGDLLAMLRKDLQLDAGTDLLNKSVGPDSIAPQVAGSVSIASITAANGVLTNFAAWGTGTLTSGTYLKAANAGLIAVRAGVYLTRARLRWDAGVTGARVLYVSANAVVDGESEVVVPASNQSPGMTTVSLAACAAGDALSLAYLHSQGGAVTTLGASVTAYWIGQRT